ncbi:MmcQ/YjbR family DNA-binding protein [Rheinheimera mesophila]|uniref:MmcQ/YjbR family DNA-binding protein n=1 Tax=Rheinheimera mesophila TaxID=1547515 RepID=A0A3P3QDA0_9GAMM|nr:MmcQ/YjbR family DNA-binding protein [Rheinheimera mesophila]KKL02348.1 MmcQ-like protein [Rheinheimera mesophila]RRJ19015.1 MmcQ/YjbR family DNA-binding protein [Rheinheimera mesophila]
MYHSDVRDYCLELPGTEEDFPFGVDIYVYKVKGKIFAILFTGQGEARLNLKCDPDEALALRDIFPAISPGYHMNKKHWNTLRLNQTVPEREIKRQIDQSRLLVLQSFTKVQRQTVLNETEQNKKKRG